MRLRTCVLTAVVAAGLSAVPASGALMSYNINANGAKEVNAAGTPNLGDTNATASGFIILDNGTGSGTTGSATISLAVANVDGTFSGHHIHQAPATTTGPIVLDFGNPNTILTGSATTGVLSGTISGLPAATITNIFANPTAFYYNLHSTPNFPAGAVRDQLVPEPGSVGLLGAAAVGLLVRRRKAQRA